MPPIHAFLAVAMAKHRERGVSPEEGEAPSFVSFRSEPWTSWSGSCNLKMFYQIRRPDRSAFIRVLFP